jgi:LPXTG-motif cell wall-anchored protein
MLLPFAVVPNWRAYGWDLMVVGLVVMGGVSLYWLRKRKAGGQKRLLAADGLEGCVDRQIS